MNCQKAISQIYGKDRGIILPKDYISRGWLPVPRERQSAFQNTDIPKGQKKRIYNENFSKVAILRKEKSGAQSQKGISLKPSDSEGNVRALLFM